MVLSDNELSDIWAGTHIIRRIFYIVLKLSKFIYPI